VGVSAPVQGPDWMRGVMVDSVAIMPKGAPEDQIPEMLQSLRASGSG